MNSIGFGFEKIGKVALRWPGISTALVLIACFISGIGLPYLTFDDAVRDVFRTSRPEFVRYQAFLEKFTNAGADTFVLLEGDRLDRHLEALRDTAFEAQLLDNIGAAVSIFSLRKVGADGTLGGPLFPETLPEGEALTQLLKRADQHPLNGGRLLSTDRRYFVLALSLTREGNPKGTFRTVERDLNELFSETLPAGIKATITGLPAMHRYVIGELVRDVFVLNFAGLVLAIIIGLFTLGNFWAAAITAFPPVCAVLWMLGGMAISGVSVNLMTNVLPVLILILAFADSMHLTYEVRRHRRNDGASARRAGYRAVTRVGPACVLAGITTMVAFFTLSLSDSALIRSFGQTGVFAVFGAMLSVLVVHPLTIYWLGRFRIARSWSMPHEGRRFISLTGISRRIGIFTQDRPKAVALAGLAAALVFGTGHYLVKPTYSFLENVPASAETFRALNIIETKLGGGHSVYLPIALKHDGGLFGEENIIYINEITKVVEKSVPRNEIYSAATVARWLRPEDPGSAGRLMADLVEQLPEQARANIQSADRNTALVSIRLADEGSAETRALIAKVDTALARAFPEVSPPFKVTGHMALSAQTGEWMIGRLNYALLAAVALSILIISIAFRSVRAGLYAVIPNLLPILAAGTALYLSGRGLQFTSAIALTIAFGIAVDDTIHFLSAYRLGRKYRRTTRDAVLYAYDRAGPALIATTAILCAGLLVSILSNLPMVHLFGFLSALTLFIALVADMIVLPAIIGAVARKEKAE